MGWIIREVIKRSSVEYESIDNTEYVRSESRSEVNSTEKVALKVFNKSITNWRCQKRSYPMDIELHYSSSDVFSFTPSDTTLQKRRSLDAS